MLSPPPRRFPLSAACGHTYERAAIEALLHSLKPPSTLQCPIKGCTSQVTRASLKVDEQKVLDLEAFNRRSKRRKQVGDDET